MSKDINKVSFIKDCMADALETLMKDRAIKDISIDEITNLAGVGRATYFRNFDSKYEVLAYKQIKEWKAWRDKHNLGPTEEFDFNNALSTFQFQYNIRERTRRRFTHPEEYKLVNSIVIKEVIIPDSNNEYTDMYKIAFFSYGLVGLLQKWAENDFKESPEEMVTMVGKWLK